MATSLALRVMAGANSTASRAAATATRRPVARTPLAGADAEAAAGQQPLGRQQGQQRRRSPAPANGISPRRGAGPWPAKAGRRAGRGRGRWPTRRGRRHRHQHAAVALGRSARSRCGRPGGSDGAGRDRLRRAVGGGDRGLQPGIERQIGPHREPGRRGHQVAELASDAVDQHREGQLQRQGRLVERRSRGTTVGAGSSARTSRGAPSAPTTTVGPGGRGQRWAWATNTWLRSRPSTSGSSPRTRVSTGSVDRAGGRDAPGPARRGDGQQRQRRGCRAPPPVGHHHVDGGIGGSGTDGGPGDDHPGGGAQGGCQERVVGPDPQHLDLGPAGPGWPPPGRRGPGRPRLPGTPPPSPPRCSRPAGSTGWPPRRGRGRCRGWPR